MRDEFIVALTEHADKNKNVFLLTGDLGFSVFEDFAGRFPGRFINAGIAEANMMGMAAGLALSGKIAVAYSIIPFSITRCLEQIKIDVCYHKANVKIVGVGAGYAYGALGITHHAIEDISVMRAYPNMRILSPCDGIETASCVDLALETDGPFYIRLGKSRGQKIHEEKKSARLGGSNLIRDGRDVSIIATGAVVQNALEAADILSKKGVSSRVVSMYSIKPIDEQAILESCSRTAVLVTLEEHTILGGLGGAVSEVLAESDSGSKKAVFKRLGIVDTFCDTVGGRKYLIEKCGLSPTDIADKLMEALEACNEEKG